VFGAISKYSSPIGHSLAIIAAATLFVGCAEQAPVAPVRMSATAAEMSRSKSKEIVDAIATLRSATGRYHNVELAKRDGFVLLHECESRPGEGPVGTVYVHIQRLLDGKIDPTSPDALIYEPQTDGSLELVGAEFAVPYPLWTQPQPPKFLDATFQREDEFGVFALHAWVWRENPEGLFAETNPSVSCGA
jgi:hypothetical protein